MGIIIWSLVGYVVLAVVVWLVLDDPWTKVGTAASLLGTAIAVLTLALVSFIKRDLIAKGRLPPLLARMRSLNGELATALGRFGDDPDSVRRILFLIAGLLLSIDGKVAGEYRKMVRDVRKQIESAHREGTWYRKPVVLTEELAREIYVSLIRIEEAVKHLISDLQRS